MIAKVGGIPVLLGLHGRKWSRRHPPPTPFLLGAAWPSCLLLYSRVGRTPLLLGLLAPTRVGWE